MPLRAKFLFAADLGDPITSVYLTDVGCCAGTILGKVWLYSFDTKQHEELSAFSDEGVRGLYLDNETCCATIGGEGIRGWARAPPHTASGSVNFRSFDKKNTQNVKHVLQFGPWACVIFPTSSIMMNVVTQEHSHCQFKLFDYGSSQELVPCDFDGKTVVVIDRSLNGSSPAFRFVNLEQTESVSQIDVEDLPHRGSVTFAKLWGPDHLAYVAGGSSVYLYDYRRRAPSHRLTGHTAEIIAMDSSDSKVIATLSSDAQIIRWDGATGKQLQILHVPEASFFLGYPYCLTMHGHKILVTADEGAILLDFEQEHSEQQEPAAPVKLKDSL